MEKPKDQSPKTEPAATLNQLLSTYQIFLMNVRGFHWNVKGQDFFEMHAQYEHLYDELLLKVDKLAERMLSIEQAPLHAYSDYMKQSVIEECKNQSKSRDINREIVASLKRINQLEQQCIEAAEEARDLPTQDMLAAFLDEHQKKAWMFSSTLK